MSGFGAKEVRGTGRSGSARAAVILFPALALALLLALALPSRPAGAAGIAAPPLQADRILVLKSKRVLALLRDGIVLKSYPIALGRHPVGAKRKEGDGKTPEGLYWIDGRNERSAYHLSLHISYPDAQQKLIAAAARRAPGGDIFIHGLPDRFARWDPIRFDHDWTEGCIAVSNRAIEEIWNAVADGVPIEIRP